MNNLNDVCIKLLARFIAYFVVLTIASSVILWLLCRYGFGVILNSDNGIVDWLEVLWLCLSSLFLFLASRRAGAYNKLFGIIWLLPLTGAMREGDAWFDLIFHGAWIIPAAVIALVVAYKIFRSPPGLGSKCLSFVQTHQAALLGVGFFIVVVFAQLSGKQAVWHVLLGDNYERNAGRFVEEWLEFLGYIIIVIGSLECFLCE